VDKDKKWDRKEVVVEWMFISMGREKPFRIRNKLYGR